MTVKTVSRILLFLFGGVAVVSAMILSIKKGTTPAQKGPPLLQITSPSDRTIVASGQTITVLVVPSPNVTFTHVVVIGEHPIGFSEIRTSPPFEFQMTIPPKITPRTYRLTADGVISPGVGAKSTPITLLVENSNSSTQLRVEPSQIHFQIVGDQYPLRVYGTFQDGATIDLTDSSQTTYSSSDPSVAVISSTGRVTALGPGMATITIQHKNQSTDVRLSVPATVPGDLDGDGDVDTQDLNYITEALNMPVNIPIDPRDLNKDGVINALDMGKFTLLCTRPRCATQ